MKLAPAVWMLIALAGCGVVKSTKSLPVAAALPSATTPEYIDLEPGSRLRIVAPVTRSGSYHVEVKPVEQKGNVISLKSSDDLIGYETAFWSVTARPGGGVSIRFDSAELTLDGKPAPLQKPNRAVVHVPRSARFVRIFYLTRKSDADHNMALAGAAGRDQIEAFTRAFHDSPTETCVDRPRERIYCEWIPAGMAVRPEVPKIVDGVTRWPNQ